MSAKNPRRWRRLRLRVATGDIGAYEQFVINKLTPAPGIARIDSHLTMKAIK
jgi:hypothetical protein